MFARLDGPHRARATCRRRRRGRKGVERNVVLTMWDWGGPATFAHDELTTDKRNPTANAYGPIYGVDWGNDGFLIVDPLEHTAEELRIPGARPEGAAGQGADDAGAVAVLGRQAVLVRPGDHEPRRDGRQGPRVDVVAVPPARGSAGLLRHASVGGAGAAEDAASGRCSTSIRRRASSSR